MEKPKDARGAPPLKSGVNDGRWPRWCGTLLFPTQQFTNEYFIYWRHIRLSGSWSSRPTPAGHHLRREDSVGRRERGKLCRRLRHYAADRRRILLRGPRHPYLGESHLGQEGDFRLSSAPAPADSSRELSGGIARPGSDPDQSPQRR